VEHSSETKKPIITKYMLIRISVLKIRDKKSKNANFIDLAKISDSQKNVTFPIKLRQVSIGVKFCQFSQKNNVILKKERKSWLSELSLLKFKTKFLYLLEKKMSNNSQNSNLHKLKSQKSSNNTNASVEMESEPTQSREKRSRSSSRDSRENSMVQPKKKNAPAILKTLEEALEIAKSARDKAEAALSTAKTQGKPTNKITKLENELAAAKSKVIEKEGALNTYLNADDEEDDLQNGAPSGASVSKSHQIRSNNYANRNNSSPIVYTNYADTTNYVQKTGKTSSFIVPNENLYGPVIVFLSQTNLRNSHCFQSNLDYLFENYDVVRCEDTLKGDLRISTSSEKQCNEIVEDKNFFGEVQKRNIANEALSFIINNISFKDLNEDNEILEELYQLGVHDIAPLSRNQENHVKLVKAYCDKLETKSKLENTNIKIITKSQRAITLTTSINVPPSEQCLNCGS
jgi:hypothetical protein